jgi:uncharacterized protein YjbI with pentapeptide repeats
MPHERDKGEQTNMAELTREQVLHAVISGRGPAYLIGVDLSRINLSNAGWLMDADLRMSNLSHANLTGANLQGARLERANLDGATLATARLNDADMRNAKLTVVNLRKASLKNANLERARLIGAVLVQTDFEGANLEGADLEGANLEGACLRNANLSGANLRLANLRAVEYDSDIRSVAGVPDDSDERGAIYLAKGFDGSVNAVALVDVIQILCLAQSTLRIYVTSSNKEGTVYMASGRVSHAETTEQRGEAAFIEMLAWPNGTFHTLPIEDEPPTTIQKPLEHLLVEALRRQDERSLEAV